MSNNINLKELETMRNAFEDAKDADLTHVLAGKLGDLKVEVLPEQQRHANAEFVKGLKTVLGGKDGKGGLLDLDDSQSSKLANSLEHLAKSDSPLKGHDVAQVFGDAIELMKQGMQARETSMEPMSKLGASTSTFLEDFENVSGLDKKTCQKLNMQSMERYLSHAEHKHRREELLQTFLGYIKELFPRLNGYNGLPAAFKNDIVNTVLDKPELIDSGEMFIAPFVYMDQLGESNPFQKLEDSEAKPLEIFKELAAFRHGFANSLFSQAQRGEVDLGTTGMDVGCKHVIYFLAARDPDLVKVIGSSDNRLEDLQQELAKYKDSKDLETAAMYTGASAVLDSLIAAKKTLRSFEKTAVESVPVSEANPKESESLSPALETNPSKTSDSGAASQKAVDNVIATSVPNPQDDARSVSEHWQRHINKKGEVFAEPEARSRLLDKLQITDGKVGTFLKEVIGYGDNEKDIMEKLENEYKSQVEIGRKNRVSDQLTRDALSLLQENKLIQSNPDLQNRMAEALSDRERLNAWIDKNGVEFPMNPKPFFSDTLRTVGDKYVADRQTVPFTQQPCHKVASHPNAGKGNDVPLNAVYGQHANTCFMMSVANMLATTEAGRGYLNQWLGDHDVGSGTQRREGMDFSDFECKVGELYRSSLDGANWNFGQVGEGDKIAGLMGLDVRFGCTMDSTTPDWKVRELLCDVAKSLRNQDFAQLYTSNGNGYKHYVAVVGTYGAPFGSLDQCGLIVRDSVDQTEKKISAAELTQSRNQLQVFGLKSEGVLKAEQGAQVPNDVAMVARPEADGQVQGTSENPSVNARLEKTDAALESLMQMLEKLGTEDEYFDVQQCIVGEALVQASDQRSSQKMLQRLSDRMDQRRADLGKEPTPEALFKAFDECRVDWRWIDEAGRGNIGVNGIGSAGTELLPKEAQAARNRLCDEGGQIVKGMISKDSPYKDLLTDNACRLIASLCLEKGTPVDQATEFVCKSLASLQPILVQGDARTVEGILEGILHAQTPAEKSQWVDVFCQQSYPEDNALALSIKQSLCSNDADRQAVTTLHNLTIAKHSLMVRAKALDKEHAGTKETSFSSMTYLLDAKTTQALLQKSGIEHLKFHLANIAVLEAHCLEAGLIDLPFSLTNVTTPEGKKVEQVITDVGYTKSDFDRLSKAEQDEFRKAYAELYLRNRAEALQLDDYVSMIKSEQKREGKASYLEKLNAAVALFDKGFVGPIIAKEVDQRVKEASSFSGRSFGHMFERNMLRSNLGTSAMELLDRYVEHLTQVTDPRERIFGAQSLAKNGAVIDAKMRNKVASLLPEKELKKQALLQGANDDLLELSDFKDKTLESIKGCRRHFLAHVKNFKKLTQIDETRMSEHQEAVSVADLNRQMSDLYKKIDWAWPHQRSARREIYNSVLELEPTYDRLKTVANQLAANPEDKALAAEKEILEGEVSRLLDKLKGVDPKTMRRTLKDKNKVPTLLTVIEQMIPNAKALSYFDKGQGKVDAARIKSAQYKNDTYADQISKINSEVAKIYGKETISELKNVINAAILKVAVGLTNPLTDTTAALKNFSIHSPQTQQAIQDQLKAWGIDYKAGSFMSHLVQDRMLALSDTKGQLSKDAIIGFGGLIGAIGFKPDNKEASHISNRLAAEFDQARYDLRRKEGVHNMFSMLENPGDSFTYNAKTGEILPITPVGQIAEKLGLPISLVLKLDMPRDDSIQVMKRDNGAFEVLMKTEKALAFFASVGLNAGFTEHLSLVNGSLGGLYGKGEGDGVVLTFPDQASCEACVRDFLDPNAAMHQKGHAWTDAIDVQVYHVRKEQSVQNEHGGAGGFVFKRSLASIDEKAVHEQSHSFQHNVKGNECREVERYRATLNTGFVFDLLPKDIQVRWWDGVERTINPSRRRPVAETVKTLSQIVDGNGVSDKTSMSFTFSKGDLNLIEALGFGNLKKEELEDLLKGGSEIFSKMDATWNSLSASDRMTVKYEINPDAQKKLQILRNQMEVVEVKDKDRTRDKQLEDEYLRTVRDPANYHPASIRMEQVPINDHNGGMDDLMVAHRATTLSHMNVTTFAFPKQGSGAIGSAQKPVTEAAPSMSDASENQTQTKSVADPVVQQAMGQSFVQPKGLVLADDKTRAAVNKYRDVMMDFSGLAQGDLLKDTMNAVLAKIDCDSNGKPTEFLKNLIALGDQDAKEMLGKEFSQQLNVLERNALQKSILDQAADTLARYANHYPDNPQANQDLVDRAKRLLQDNQKFSTFLEAYGNVDLTVKKDVISNGFIGSCCKAAEEVTDKVLNDKVAGTMQKDNLPQTESVVESQFGPTLENLGTGKLYKQNAQTCFMMSIANALCMKDEGVAYLKDWMRAQEPAPQQAGFNPFELMFGRSYNEQNEIHRGWKPGDDGMASPALNTLGLPMTGGCVLDRNSDLLAKQEVWIDATEHLGRGEMGVVHLKEKGHFIALIGTYGKPSDGPANFGFIIRDSLDGSQSMYSVDAMSQNYGQGTFTFFKLPEGNHALVS